MNNNPFEQYKNLSQLPHDLVTFIIQIMENRCRETVNLKMKKPVHSTVNTLY